MAELYHKVRPDSLEPPPTDDGRTPPLPDVPEQLDERRELFDDLPGKASLDRRGEEQLLFDGIASGVTALASVIDGAGLATPDLPRFAAMIRVSGPEAEYQLAAGIAALHTKLLVRLRAADEKVGKAYGLGRALADLSLRPHKEDEASFVNDLRTGRVVGLIAELRDLKSALPPHAAEAVSWSMKTWQEWAQRPEWDHKPLVWADHSQQIIEALMVQGRRWRLVLSGQKDPLDQLTADDYVLAGGFLLGRMRGLAQRAAVQYWPYIVAIVVLVMAGVVSALLLAGSTTRQGLGVAVSLLGGIGITTAGARTVIGKAAAVCSDYLWEAELDLAVGRALLALPLGANAPVIGERPIPLVRGGAPRRQRARHDGRRVA
jgi:hypothetical protein